MSVTMPDILRARQRITRYLLRTPIEDAPKLGPQVSLKLENLNKTRAFKVRGALNALLATPPSARAAGVVACSAGNHAQGVAYAAQIVGAHAKVVMPVGTPQRKVDGARHWGADITLYGEDYDSAEAHAHKLADQMDMAFISPYNDPLVVAGQGTIGLELFESIPDLGRVVVPTSGGGLLAGVAIACKTLNPACEVIGVQSEATPTMYNYFYGEHRPEAPTIADGLAGDIEAGAITLELCRGWVDHIALVSEDAIREAIRWTLQQHGWVAEGAGVVGIAAYLSGVLTADDRPTVILLSGGNIDYAKLRELIL